jgi:hypothetical protein
MNRDLEESLVDSQTKVLVFEKLQRDGTFDYQKQLLIEGDNETEEELR